MFHHFPKSMAQFLACLMKINLLLGFAPRKNRPAQMSSQSRLLRASHEKAQAVKQPVNDKQPIRNTPVYQ